MTHEAPLAANPLCNFWLLTFDHLLPFPPSCRHPLLLQAGSHPAGGEVSLRCSAGLLWHQVQGRACLWLCLNDLRLWLWLWLDELRHLRLLVLLRSGWLTEGCR